MSRNKQEVLALLYSLGETKEAIAEKLTIPNQFDSGKEKRGFGPISRYLEFNGVGGSDDWVVSYVEDNSVIVAFELGEIMKGQDAYYDFSLYHYPRLQAIAHFEDAFEAGQYPQCE